MSETQRSRLEKWVPVGGGIAIGMLSFHAGTTYPDAEGIFFGFAGVFLFMALVLTWFQRGGRNA